MKQSCLLPLSLSLMWLMLTSCAQTSQLAKIEPSDWTTLTCSGFLTWHECRKQALTLCPNGYYTSDYLENYTIQRREMSVACKD